MRFGMSWFKRENGDFPAPAIGPAKGPEPENGDQAGRTVRTEGLWIKCVGCRADDLEGRSRSQPQCLSQVPAPLQDRRAAAHRYAAGAGLRAGGRRIALYRSAELHRREAVQAAAAQGAGADRPGRRDCECGGPDGPARRGGERHGVRLHRRLNGRGGGRDDCPRRGPRPAGPQAAHRGGRLRRRAHDGGRGEPDADGQNLDGAGAARRRRACLTSACSPTPPPAA